jgi:acid phosphatase
MRRLFRCSSFLVVLVLAISSFIGCGGSSTSRIVGGIVPTITLSVNPGSITAGQSATLSWTSMNATSVTIDNGIGAVALQGSMTVNPAASTVYRATAAGQGLSATAQATLTVSQPGGGGEQAGHVFLVVEENHSYSEVIGNPQMPYLNSLAAQGAVATQYFANTHPSIGNYFELTTGNVITNDDAFSGVVSLPDIVTSLEAAGKTWKSYAESLPSVGYTGGDVPPYLRHHNPFSYFAEVQNSTNEKNNLQPFSQFSIDLNNNQLPSFSFIVPNVNDDAHNGTLQQADQWLQATIAPLLASPTFQTDGLLIIVFDESDVTDIAMGGGHVAWVAMGPRIKKGFKSTKTYQHQSTLRLVLNSLGATVFPGDSASAPDMAEFFQ